MSVLLAVALAWLVGSAPGPAGGQTIAGTAQVQGDAGSASIRGVVVRAENGTPVLRATLSLTASGGGMWESATDPNGAFEFTHLPPGRFTLVARRPGYASRESLPLTLKAGERLDRVTIPLLRGAAIEGRLFDETGEPLVEVHVRAMRAEYISAGRRLRAVTGAETDDLGHYRLYGLPPGRYFVVAAIQSADLMTYDPDKPVETVRGASGFAPTFYPGTVIAADARPLQMRAGEEALVTDFMLRAVRLARISGVVVDSRGRPAPGNLIMLNAARTGGAAVTGSLVDMGFTEVKADGSFALANVKPGEYRLDVVSTQRLERIAQTGGSVGLPQEGASAEYASVPLAVNGDDIEGLRVTLAAGRRISGRIVVHGAAAAANVFGKMKLAAFDSTAGPGMSAVMLTAGVDVQPDGSFDVRGVSGTRLFQVYGLPSRWALEAVRLSGMDVTDVGVDVRDQDVADVEVIVTASPPGIVGTVFESMNHPLAGASIVVFPEDASRWAAPPNRYLAAARSDEQGRFSVSPLPAGDYLVALADEFAEGEWAEPDLLGPLRATAVRVTLREGQTAEVTLRPSRNPIR